MRKRRSVERDRRRYERVKSRFLRTPASSLPRDYFDTMGQIFVGSFKKTLGISQISSDSFAESREDNVKQSESLLNFHFKGVISRSLTSSLCPTTRVQIHVGDSEVRGAKISLSLSLEWNMTTCKTAYSRTWRARLQDPVWTRSSESLVDFLFADGSHCRSVSPAKNIRVTIRPSFRRLRKSTVRTQRVDRHFTRSMVVANVNCDDTRCHSEFRGCGAIARGGFVSRTRISRVTATVRSHVRVGRRTRGQNEEEKPWSIPCLERIAREPDKAGQIFCRSASERAYSSSFSSCNRDRCYSIDRPIDRPADRPTDRPRRSRGGRAKREDPEFMSRTIPTQRRNVEKRPTCFSSGPRSTRCGDKGRK